MKNSLTAVLLVATLTVLTGCFGSGARQNVLLPATAGAWFSNGVEDDIERGIADAFEDGEITQGEADGWRAIVDTISDAFDAEDRSAASTAVIANWADLRTFAERGVQDRVDDGELSDADFNENGTPDFVESYIERLNNFEESSGVLGEQTD